MEEKMEVQTDSAVETKEEYYNKWPQVRCNSCGTELRTFGLHDALVNTRCPFAPCTQRDEKGRPVGHNGGMLFLVPVEELDW
jgi:hypothetical protein